MNALDQLSSLSDAALDSHIVRLAANERTSTVDLLVSLVALQRRHNAAGLGFKLWTYCHSRLQMAEGTASRYTSAVKLLGQFPAAEPLLRDGRLNPTTFTALEDILTEENHEELLRRASGLSQREIQILLAELQPKPDVEESMRFVPDRTPRSRAPTSAAEVPGSVTPVLDSRHSADLLERTSSAQVPGSVSPLLDSPRPADFVELTSAVEVAHVETRTSVVTESTRPADRFEVARLAAAEVERRHGLTVTATVTTGDFTSLLPKDLPPSKVKAKLKPLRKGHYVIEINCDQQFADELEDLRMTLSHIVPGAELGGAIREAVRRTLKDVQRRKFGLCSSTKVERPEESGTSTVEVSPRRSKRSTPKKKVAGTSAVEVVSSGPTSSEAVTPSAEVASSTRSPSSIHSTMRGSTLPDRTSTTEVEPLASQSPSRTRDGTSTTEVGRNEPTAPPPTGSRTSIVEVRHDESTATPPAGSRASITEVDVKESTTPITTLSRSSATGAPMHSSSSTSASTVEVPGPSEIAELIIPSALYDAFNMQTDGAQFIPPWLRSVRTLPAEVKRDVYVRDGGCCSFVGSTGHRCSSRYRLEYDHWLPYAQGGEPTVENIRLLCRHHNIYTAFQTFGIELMSRYVRVH